MITFATAACESTDGPPISEPVQAAPALDADTERLGDEIATLAAHIHAATYRLLVLIREFDERKGWAWGFRSCAHWLSWRTGIAPGPAREKVRVAGALASLPRISEAMSRGELSYSKVRAMTRVASPDNEEDLVNVARHSTAAHMERLVRAWRMVDRLDDAQAEEQRHQSRFLDLFPDDDGSWVLKARLDPEVGALLRKALEWASEALYQREPPADSGSGDALRTVSATQDRRAGATTDDPGAAATPGQRRADALGFLAERALAERALMERALTEREPAPSGAGEPSPADSAEGTRSIPLGRADRFQVVLHVGSETLLTSAGIGEERAGDAMCRSQVEAPNRQTGSAAHVPAETHSQPGDAEAAVPAETCSQPTHGRTDVPRRPSAWLAEGPMGVSGETSRRLACDAGIVEMHHGPDGDILDVGRKRRTVPPAIRRALEHRDGGCRFPGCGCRFTDAHHITHWADGGETKLDNLILLCRRHHRALHEEGFRVEVVEAEGAGPEEIVPHGSRWTSGKSRPGRSRPGKSPGNGSEGSPGIGPEGNPRNGPGRSPGSGPLKIRFLRPDGRGIPEVPEPPEIPSDPVTTMVRTHAAAGIEPEPQANTPLWYGEPLDVSLALDMLRR